MSRSQDLLLPLQDLAASRNWRRPETEVGLGLDLQILLVLRDLACWSRMVNDLNRNKLFFKYQFKSTRKSRVQRVELTERRALLYLYPFKRKG
jgi:hypothetical protein